MNFDETVTFFVDRYYNAAKYIEKKYGIPVRLSMAQASIEGGWGKMAVGNNTFGVKAYPPTNFPEGRRQFVMTTEFFNTPNYKFPSWVKVVSVKPEGNQYRYVIYDWFRKYINLEESFEDYAKLITGQYKKALVYKDNPYMYGLALAKLGYFTANAQVYAGFLRDRAKAIQGKINNMGLSPSGGMLLIGIGIAATFLILNNKKTEEND